MARRSVLCIVLKSPRPSSTERLECQRIKADLIHIYIISSIGFYSYKIIWILLSCEVIVNYPLTVVFLGEMQRIAFRHIVVCVCLCVCVCVCVCVCMPRLWTPGNRFEI